MLKTSFQILGSVAATAVLAAGLRSLSQPLPAQAQSTFVPSEVQVSDPQARVIDMEFDQSFSRFTWVDFEGNLWIGQVDPNTGDFVPPTGKSILVTTGAANVNVVGNTSEWVFTGNGPQIVYTTFDQEGRIALGRALLSGNRWTASILQQGVGKFGPIGSLDRFDPNPRISYIGPGNRRNVSYWRYLNDPASEEQVPNSDQPGGRWVPGLPITILSEPTRGGRQAYLYNIETKCLKQLTSDSGVKTAVFMLQAPEYDNEYVFFTLVDEVELRVYRRIDNKEDTTLCNGNWQQIATIKPPSTNNYLWSPEFFVHNGRSYVFMVVSPSDDNRSVTIPTEIWLASLDGTFYRRLSDATVRVRKDPEVFFTSQGPQIYYNTFADPEAQIPVIYRLDTGLGPKVD